MERNVILNTHMYAYGCKRDRNTNKVVSRYASSEGMNLLLVMPLSELPFTYLLPKTSPYSRSRTGREAVIGEGTEVVFGEKLMKIHTITIQEKWPASQVVTRYINGERRNNHCTNLQMQNGRMVNGRVTWKKTKLYGLVCRSFQACTSNVRSLSNSVVTVQIFVDMLLDIWGIHFNIIYLLVSIFLRIRKAVHSFIHLYLTHIVG